MGKWTITATYTADAMTAEQRARAEHDISLSALANFGIRRPWFSVADWIALAETHTANAEQRNADDDDVALLRDIICQAMRNARDAGVG